MTSTRQHLSIGKVAVRSGYSVSAIRHYEAVGLVQSAGRNGHQRMFDRSVLRRLAFITAGRNVGLSLSQLAKCLADMPVDRAPTPEDWKRISRPWQEIVDARIRALSDLRISLENCIGCGCLSMTACGVLNPQDEAADEGPGSRWVQNA